MGLQEQHLGAPLGELHGAHQGVIVPFMEEVMGAKLGVTARHQWQIT